MAVKWAITDGNWSTGAIWNDGAVPVDGDIVYTNGHTVNLTTITTLFSENARGELHNDANSDLGIVEGGYFAKTTEGSITIYADLFGGSVSTYFFNMTCTSTNTKTVTIYGNAISNGCIMVTLSSSNVNHRIGTLTQFGNIELYGNARMSYGNSMSINITGDYIKHNSTNVCFQAGVALRDVNLIVSEVIVDGGGSLFSPIVPSNFGITFGGDVVVRNNSHIMNFSSTSDWVNKSIMITGNLTLGDTSSFVSGATGQTNTDFVISGKLILENIARTTTYSNYKDYALITYVSDFVIGGGVEGYGRGMMVSGAVQFQNVSINGNINISGDLVLVNNGVRSLTFLSSVETISYNTCFPLPIHRTNTISVLNPNGINVIYTGDSTPEFLILGKYNLNNTDQYPAPSNVKKDIPYAWGELVGTYTTDYPPETVVLKDYEYDTITAEENDIATYNLTRYIYADYGTLHWFELKTTTTDIVTTPSQQSISIDGETVVADTDYVVEYDDACYQWSGSAWGSITTKNIGTVKTDIVTNPTEATLCAKKGSLEVVNLPQTTLDRMANTLTIDIFQQILDAHLNN